ncbi:glycine--tRNA ligase subunit beta [Caulobacter vibrioides]|uniref:Glycine--tRNA ligase beta subunit n=2 Tax=Caulobacter vibrioides TaxID=155892 RepID=Q9A8L1_CAUVC|nr:glycine--tRNA ligase subunit beta [Caulobacter vibrioides]YP_002516777.1 glycyl-tRNA synthetase beta chain [Caulobacter vibrioides NA1000]QBQ57038.1 glycine--tRNA ligase subunit beta [synthetic Caulobacter sp. 'ethensis']AAK23323.1 glycyl-tRNA synthetase, beta subunit [Caulobacter vibrioides CB15]ACL94869.1 glycyl-tRNA synthetase beta chain [Caulobacter vibrioides NA1000]ATC28155.1 glycine--tRNA ligase subunit beta [Caulobacter vibrioides]QXZ53419.1 glycine--tRNA ligase subunit beta [Caulo
MPQLLLELFSEEIPARMQAQAAKDLERMAREHLAAAGFLPEALKTFAGPRRLTLVAEGLPLAQADRKEELKGPRVGAPPQAMEGFLRKAGLTQDQLVERDGVYMAFIEKKGRPTAEIIAEMVEAIVRGFPWPKSMIWGTKKLRWVRPLKRILCVLDREVVPFAIEGIESGDVTEGHRFMGEAKPFVAKDFDEYVAGLEKHFVVLDVEERKARILEGCKTLCFARHLELVEDQGLLDEVAGLAEWPTPVLGDMDPVFLSLPPEVIRTSMRTHQKYFAVRKAGEEGLAPHFITIANIQPADGGAVIAAGNAKVLSSRLSDARFFWDEDVKVGFEPWLKKLDGVTFHAKLGTMAQRVERIVALAAEIAPLVGADVEKTKEAARLAKADLASQMVGEFPELQGIMGGYYARTFGLDHEIADAVRDHYKPQGPSDAVPTAPVSIAVALADKLDTLASFFAIEEKPTGSKDPYALRRAALGAIRIILENNRKIGFRMFFVPYLDRMQAEWRAGVVTSPRLNADWLSISTELLAFFADRLKVTLRDQGKRHDLVDAVFALGDDDLARIVARVEALDGFLKTDDGKNLLAGYKRASNILKAEEKKGALPTGAPAEPAADSAAEVGLYNALRLLDKPLKDALAKEDFTGAMTQLAELRGPVDAYLDGVFVNEPEHRDNRLRTLATVRDAMGQVADFGLIGG